MQRQAKDGSKRGSEVPQSSETSQAHRQTLNPIVWASSRKWIVGDRRGGDGGGPSSIILLQHTAESASPSAAAAA